MNWLSGPQRRVLQPVIAAWPDEMSVEELSDATGYEAGGALSTTRAAACTPWVSSTIPRPAWSWRTRFCS